MSTAPTTPLNIKPAEWSGAAGERWAANIDSYEAMLTPIGRALLAHAELSPGLSIAEIGCGGGDFSRALASEVGSDGRVVGVDISPTLTALARRRADGVVNLRFVTADAGAAPIEEAAFDRLMSRFGIMFFADPPAAFANLRKMLRPGGRADFAVWGPASENPSVAALATAARRHLPLPAPVPRAPGPLALEDAAYFGGLLAGAGFIGSRFEIWRGMIPVGGGVDAQAAASFCMNSASIAETIAEQPEELQQRIRTDLEAMLAEYETPSGVMMPCAVHLVTSFAES